MNEWQVLVIEDEDDSMEVVQGLLDHHGIESVGVSTGEEALNVLEQMRPSLIIVDLALPGLNGWELLEHFKAHPVLKKVPRVAITAYHTAELAEEAIEAGFSAYFPKPLDATSFVRELEGIVNG
jgi:two-component system, cell cycle response regulator DivK